MSDHLVQFSQERYDYEATRRGELTGAVAIPIGVLSVIGGALVAVLKDLHAPLAVSEWVLLLAAACSLGVAAVSTYFLARSYFGFTYEYVATPKQVLEYHAEVKSAYVGAGVTPDLAAHYADEKVLEYIQQRYAETTHRNTQNNDKKSYFLHLANGAMIGALVPAAIAGGAYLYVSYHAAPAVTRVELVNAGSQIRKESCCANPHSAGSASAPASSASQRDAAGTATKPANQGASGSN